MAATLKVERDIIAQGGFILQVDDTWTATMWERIGIVMSRHGPHKHDISLRDLVGVLLGVKAGAYVIEDPNPRHEHEHQVSENVRLPEARFSFRAW